MRGREPQKKPEKMSGAVGDTAKIKKPAALPGSAGFSIGGGPMPSWPRGLLKTPLYRRSSRTAPYNC